MQISPDKQQILAPYDWYRSMRATQPVFYDPQYSVWHVFRYADVERVLTEYATFSSDPRTMEWEGLTDEAPILSSILRMDPPRHRQLRSLATLAFTPRVVAQMEPRIRAITNTLLEQAPIRYRSQSSPNCSAYQPNCARTSNAGPTPWSRTTSTREKRPKALSLPKFKACISTSARCLRSAASTPAMI